MPMKPMSVNEQKRWGGDLSGCEWNTRLAKRLGVDGSTVRRWVSGAVPVPNPAAAAIRAYLYIRRTTGRMPTEI